MESQTVLTYLCCVLLAGLGGWVFRHCVDRTVHLDGQQPISRELFLAKLSALEDRLKGEIVAVKVKLEDLEQFTSRLDRQLEKWSQF